MVEAKLETRPARETVASPVGGREYVLTKGEDGYRVTFMDGGAQHGRRGIATLEEARALANAWVARDTTEYQENIHHAINTQRSIQEQAEKQLGRFRKELDKARDAKAKKQLRQLIKQWEDSREQARDYEALVAIRRRGGSARQADRRATASDLAGRQALG